MAAQRPEDRGAGEIDGQKALARCGGDHGCGPSVLACNVACCRSDLVGLRGAVGSAVSGGVLPGTIGALREMEKAKRGADRDGSGQRSQRTTPDTKTLADLGISKDQRAAIAAEMANMTHGSNRARVPASRSGYRNTAGTPRPRCA